MPHCWLLADVLFLRRGSVLGLYTRPHLISSFLVYSTFLGHHFFTVITIITSTDYVASGSCSYHRLKLFSGVAERSSGVRTSGSVVRAFSRTSTFYVRSSLALPLQVHMERTTTRQLLISHFGCKYHVAILGADWKGAAWLANQLKPRKHRSSFFFNLSNTSTPLSFTFGELCIACLAP